jgi:hypothetical protein
MATWQTARLRLRCLDDAPVAANDVATLASQPLDQYQGTLLSNDNDWGQINLDVVVKTITFEGNTVTVPTTLEQ